MTLPAPEQHRSYAPSSVPCLILTLSDTRTFETDTSGQAMRAMLEEAGHQVLGYHVIPDDPMRLKALLINALADPGIHVILTNGGTGISRRDGTVEVIESFLEKRLDGFGELFRYLSYQEIGAAAMMSRAVAGIHQGRVLIALPGSTGAVRLGMEKLVIPELTHMVSQARR
ncbi:MAG: MogA/MoaB family molybdenum cofactor biosynthesis protein [Candidatus Eremiobacterota bacterium]